MRGGERRRRASHDYDFDDAYLHEQPLVGEVKFCNLSQSSPTQSTGTRATETFVGCGNNLVILEDRLASGTPQIKQHYKSELNQHKEDN
ncbi:hypothetical protein PVK06_019939 [Gossypium arboreum]|uniref:Uncharacterized protein n=1 Tax=Gossypium arboreum TaxID=29729 RepID=A0ABR0PLP0_GOSAR|nr:hypothetical protein PVK06_019939 [Gossypium arboreum]